MGYKFETVAVPLRNSLKVALDNVEATEQRIAELEAEVERLTEELRQRDIELLEAYQANAQEWVRGVNDAKQWRTYPDEVPERWPVLIARSPNYRVYLAAGIDMEQWRSDGGHIDCVFYPYWQYINLPEGGE